jgi:outer membrane assembly lipoprotein YfiO
MSLFFTSSRSRRALQVAVLIAALLAPCLSQKAALAQQPQQGQSDLSNTQRLNVIKSKLEAMRRSLSSAIAAMNSGDKGDKTKNADDPRERLRGLDKEVGAIISEVNDFQVKEDKAEKYDTSKISSLEQSTTDLNTRVDAALQATASARTTTGETPNYQPKEKDKRRLFGLLPGKKNDKYDDLTGTVAPGRDRVLFIEAAKEVRKGNHETGRLLFTTIINTYPDSAYLPLAKLAIADSFYLEGTTASLTQAGQAYEDWRTFFPTDQLADDALLKVAETEMRQMGLSDRDITHARKAEQRLKALLQRYPQTDLRPTVEAHLREVQDNLAMHNLQVARFYYDARYIHKKGGLKGSQDRLREIVEKYPNFCLMDEVLFRFASTFQEEEEPDEAAKLYQQLVRDYPNSEYIDKAKDQLNVIGASIPDPDPIKKDITPCEKPGFMANMMQQITGSANISTSHDGILITHNGEGTDLIDRAIANGGELPENVQPVIHTTNPATAERPRTTATPKP